MNRKTHCPSPLQLLILSLFIFCAGFVNADTSKYWGRKGELYVPVSKGGILNDWSHSGYQRNDEPIPLYRQVANIMDFGAVGDGIHDDGYAINKALKFVANRGAGAVYIPDGRYAVRQRINITSPNTVLRGQSREKTILYMDRPLDDLDDIPYQRARFTWRDAYIQILGGTKFISPKASKISQNVARGARIINIEGSQWMQPGMYVRIGASNPTDNSLVHYLYADSIQKVCPDDVCLKGIKSYLQYATKIKSVGPGWVEIDEELPFKLDIAWEPRIAQFPQDVDLYSGIENFSIEFKWSPARPHHYEYGYNGVFFSGVANCWARNIKVLNSDNGILISNSHMVTVDEVEVGVTKTRAIKPNRWEGHVAIGHAPGTSRSLISNFYIGGPSYYLHSVTNARTALTVIRNGAGPNMVIDFHRKHPFGCLHSNIDVGTGGRTNNTFEGGGVKGQGIPVGAYTTFYNIRKEGAPLSIPTDSAYGLPCTFGTKLVFMGDYDAQRYNDQQCSGYIIDQVDDLKPADLFASQLQAFKDVNYVPLLSTSILEDGTIVQDTASSLEATAELEIETAASSASSYKPLYILLLSPVIIIIQSLL